MARARARSSATASASGSARRLIASVSLTQDGAVYLDEQEKAISLFGLLLYAGEQGDGKAYPTTAALLQAIHDADGPGADRRAREPGGHTAARQDRLLQRRRPSRSRGDVSGSGRRLFIEVAPDDVLSTNVAGYIPGGDFD